MYVDGFVTIELIQVMPETTVETKVKTVSVSDTSRSKHVEAAPRKIIKTESKPARKVVATASASNTEIEKQMVAKPEKKMSPPLQALSQDTLAIEQAHSRKKWERVRARLEESKWYPASARRRGIEGDVELGFALNRDGYARDAKILAGSGYAMLDQAALETVKRAEPFPADGGEYRFKLRFRRL
ncbi:MAG: energy transducer TonB [Mariprofundaceae bacterium]